MFTFVGTIALLWLLEADRRRLVLTLVLFAAWANLHGGFLFGLVLIAMYLTGDVLAFVVSLNCTVKSYVDTLNGDCDVRHNRSRLVFHAAANLTSLFLSHRYTTEGERETESNK